MAIVVYGTPPIASGVDDGYEDVRFDVFDSGPHYHYIKKGVAENKVVDFDPVAMGDMLPWALMQIREKLAAHAGGEAVAELGALAEQVRRDQLGAR